MLERLANMRNSPISRFPRRAYKVKYYYDINPDTQKWEVIELPSNNVIRTYNFKEDASELSSELNAIKPFGDFGFPNFLSHK